jgi:1-acyl-sn-glycerol-3-phosphate acyltransferase
MRAWAKIALIIRSYLFAILLYVTWALFLLIGSPLLFGPRSWAMKGLATHGQFAVWLLRVVCGTRMEVRHHEKLLPGPVIVASKHQAAWDTFALIALMRDPALVMKAELLSIPLYGWFCRKFEMIPIKRELGPSALREMVREARRRAAEGREIVIFPEGTRQIPGAAPDYKPGILMLYNDLKLPVCPVALNSGVCWSRYSWLRYPGTITVEFLDPIAPGLARKDFMTALQEAIETASSRLVSEAVEELKAKGYEPSFSVRVAAKEHVAPA